jgi:RNA polymerase sigma factor (sigma-70 family)
LGLPGTGDAITVSGERVYALSLSGCGNKTAPSVVLSWDEAKRKDMQLQGADERGRFEQALLPHLAAAYNLARWLMRDDHDAEDIVQEAYLRALKSFGGFHGTDGRAWLLAIVRNACYTSLQQKRAREPAKAFDEDVHSVDTAVTPVTLLMQKEKKQAVREAVEELPVDLREVVVLRELEGLSYKEIAAIADIPMGTVMSRLARARERLQKLLGEFGNKGS